MSLNTKIIKYRPVVLMILDGWGIAPPSRNNAITIAKLPTIDKLISSYPTVTLQASGESVGLPWGEMGNSEVGHLNLGAGKIVYQDLPRITNAILNGTFFTNRYFVNALDYINNSKGKFSLHLLGLVSSGGVHSYMEHLFALLELAKRKEAQEIYIHIILDGRDTPYNSGINFLNKLIRKMEELKIGKIASLSGRYYAMDRDNHWERIEKAYNAMIGNVKGDEIKFNDPIKALEASYDKKIYDEEFEPMALYDKKGKLIGKIKDGDVVIFFNYRSDRARELTKAFVLPSFEKFPRQDYFANLNFICMTEYEKNLPVDVAFPQENINYPLSRIISDKGLKQMHIAETEKYAHVTYFFNGGREEAFEGEDRFLIPSPRIDSYAKKPEMSAREVTIKVLEELENNKYDFIVINFANPDMVAHTGSLKATVKALEYIDQCVRKIAANVLARNGAVAIVADHGNAECLLDMQTGLIDKEHSTYPVPFIIAANDFEGKNAGNQDNISNDLSLLTPSGVLADVAPTILKLMGLEKPQEMTGQSLLINGTGI